MAVKQTTQPVRRSLGKDGGERDILNQDIEIKIFEKESNAGGLCRSVEHEGFTFDYTGHLLHISNPYFENFLKDLLPEESLNKINRNSQIYTHNRFVPYPFQSNLSYLPEQVMLECLIGFSKRKHKIKATSFRDWCLKYFGTGISKHFFFPYNEKILSYDLKKVTPSWTGRFVPKIKITDLINTHTNRQVGYNHWFYYPKSGGIQTLVDRLEPKTKNKIHFNHEVKEVDIKNKIVYFENGHRESYDILITTIPLNNLLKITKSPHDSNIRNQHKKLLCNSVLNFNVGYGIKDLTDKHWLYFPEKQYPFYRFGFWNNFSKNMVPENHSSIYGELSYLPGTKSKDEFKKLTEKSIAKATEVLGLTKSDIVTEKILHIPHAYVIYDQWRDNNIEKLHKVLNQKSIYSIGRYGEWKYSSMEDAIIDGKKIAEKIINLDLSKISSQKFIAATKDKIKKERENGNGEYQKFL